MVGVTLVRSDPHRGGARAWSRFLTANRSHFAGKRPRIDEQLDFRRLALIEISPRYRARWAYWVPDAAARHGCAPSETAHAKQRRNGIRPSGVCSPGSRGI